MKILTGNKIGVLEVFHPEATDELLAVQELYREGESGLPVLYLRTSAKPRILQAPEPIIPEENR